MKKSYLIIGLLVLGFTSAFAQRQAGEKIDFSHKNPNLKLASSGEAVNDTIRPGVLSGCSGLGPFLIQSNNGGWVSGTNGYGDLEKGQFLFDAGRGEVYSIMALIGAKKAGNGDGTFEANLYMFDSNGPSSYLGTTQSRTFADIDTSGAFTTFPFATPISYAWNFFASVVVDKPGNTDSIVVLHTDLDCGGNGAWEKWDDGSWNTFASWGGADPALWIYAEVDMTFMGDNEFLVQRGTHKVNPNPAKNHAHLVYSLIDDASDVEIAIYNVNGQRLATYNRGAEIAGLHGLDLDIQSLAAGTYIYTISTDGAVEQGKFVVAE